MGKIKGRFAPMFEEMGNDPRWLLELNDFEKLIFQLVLCTIYWSNGTAPDDARYYQRRYNLRARPYQVRRALDAIKQRFSKLIANDKKLSLLNYKGYENRVSPEQPLEVDKNKNKKEKHNVGNNGQFIDKLKANPAYTGIDIERELNKCRAWCDANKIQAITERRFVNWLNRAEKPVAYQSTKAERRPTLNHGPCAGTGKLPDGKKCWCWQ